MAGGGARLREGAAFMSARQKWSRGVSYVLAVALSGVVLVAGLVLKNGDRTATTVGAPMITGAATPVHNCPPGWNYLESQYSIGGDLSDLPDSPEQALLMSASDRADQIPDGEVKHTDVKLENLKKIKKDPSESSTGPGRYELSNGRKTVGEFTVAMTLFQGKQKYYVETVTTCARAR